MPEITSASGRTGVRPPPPGTPSSFLCPPPWGACFSPPGLTFQALPCFSTSPGTEGRGGEGKGESRVCLSSQFIPWIRSRLCCLGCALKWLLASISSSPFCLRPPGKGNPGPARQQIPLCFRFPLLRPPGLRHPASGTAPAPPNTHKGNWRGAYPRPGGSPGSCSCSSPTSPSDLGPVTSPLWVSVCPLPNEGTRRSSSSNTL